MNYIITIKLRIGINSQVCYNNIEKKNKLKKKKKMKKLFELKLTDLEDKIKEINILFDNMNKFLIQKDDENEKLLKSLALHSPIENEIVKFNVGGTIFSTYRSTLTKRIKKFNSDEYYDPHLLNGLIMGLTEIKFDDNNAIFIDRSPDYFNYVLDYLRSVGGATETVQKFNLPKDEDVLREIANEAKYYRVTGLRDLIYPSIETLLGKQANLDSMVFTNEQIREFVREIIK
jgi:hypothetical protein